MAKTNITIVHDKELAADMVHQLITTRFTSKMQINNLENLFNAIASGVRNGTVMTAVDDGLGIQASGTITLSSFNTAGDTILVNGVTYTAVASGAVGPQFNVGASAAIQATNIAAAISASASMVGLATAAAVGAVVTVTALTAGVAGSAITLAKGTDTGSVMTVAGVTNGRLSGQAPVTVYSSVTYKFGV